MNLIKKFLRFKLHIYHTSPSFMQVMCYVSEVGPDVSPLWLIILKLEYNQRNLIVKKTFMPSFFLVINCLY